MRKQKINLLISWKTLASFLLWTAVAVGVFVVAIELTPQGYNVLVACVFAVAVFYGTVLAQFNRIVDEAKKKMEEKWVGCCS